MLPASRGHQCDFVVSCFGRWRTRHAGDKKARHYPCPQFNQCYSSLIHPMMSFFGGVCKIYPSPRFPGLLVNCNASRTCVRFYKTASTTRLSVQGISLNHTLYLDRPIDVNSPRTCAGMYRHLRSLSVSALSISLNLASRMQTWICTDKDLK